MPVHSHWCVQTLNSQVSTVSTQATPIRNQLYQASVPLPALLYLVACHPEPLAANALRLVRPDC